MWLTSSQGPIVGPLELPLLRAALADLVSRQILPRNCSVLELITAGLGPDFCLVVRAFNISVFPCGTNWDNSRIGYCHFFFGWHNAKTLANFESAILAAQVAKGLFNRRTCVLRVPL